MAGISVKLPLVMSEIDGAYLLNKTLQETIKQNLKMLLLTIPGERIMDPDFGVGLETFLFEMNSMETQSTISAKIHEQVSRYLPFIDLKSTIYGPDSGEFGMSPNSLHITITYKVLPTSQDDVLSLTLPQNEIEF